MLHSTISSAMQFGMNKNCDVCLSTIVSLGEIIGKFSSPTAISSQYIPLFQDTDEMKCYWKICAWY